MSTSVALRAQDTNQDTVHVRVAASASYRELFLTPVIVFCVSRLFLAAIASYAPHMLKGPRIRGNQSLLPAHDVLAGLGNWASPWFRFDAGWYVGVAQHGYHWGALGKANTNFMPLYPALIRAAQPLFGADPWLASWLVANLTFLAALVLLWRWSLMRFERDVALRVLLLTSLFPFAFFFAAPYAESLFLALAIAAFVFAEEDRWALAICTAGACAVTRPVGLAVVLALVVLAYRRGQITHALTCMLALLPLGAFALYLALAFGHPLGFLTYHTDGWVHPHGSILATVSSQFHTRLSPFDRVDAFLAGVFLMSAAVAWRRLGPAYGTFVAVGVILPLVHGLAGMERYVIVLFPAMAAWASVQNRLFQTSLFSISLLGLITGTTMWAVGFTLT